MPRRRRSGACDSAFSVCVGQIQGRTVPDRRRRQARLHPPHPPQSPPHCPRPPAHPPRRPIRSTARLSPAALPAIPLPTDCGCTEPVHQKSQPILKSQKSQFRYSPSQVQFAFRNRPKSSDHLDELKYIFYFDKRLTRNPNQKELCFLGPMYYNTN